MSPAGEYEILTTADSEFSVDWHCPVEASQILTEWSSLALARDLPSGLHATAVTDLKAFKSVSIHKNNCFEKSLGMFLRNLPCVPAHRTLGVDPERPMLGLIARAIRVFFAAKCSKF
jgi:hypothetical protein